VLNDAVLDRARVLSREKLTERDAQLKKEFERLASKLERADDDTDQISRLAVQVRLLCEQDQDQRAVLIWGALRTAHKDVAGHRAENLVRSLKQELTTQMRDGGLRLAAILREHSSPLSTIVSDKYAISADWLARRRDHATERLGKQVDDYVESLNWSVIDSVKRWFRSGS